MNGLVTSGLGLPALLNLGASYRRESGAWAGIGTQLTVGSDGSILSGDVVLAVLAGEAVAFGISGTLALPRLLGAAALTVAATPPVAAVTLSLTQPADTSGFTATFVLPSAATGALGAGFYPWRAVVLDQLGIPCTEVAGLLYVAAPPALAAHPVTTVIRRGVPESVVLSLTRADGGPYDYTGMNLVWSATGAGTVALTQAAGQITPGIWAERGTADPRSGVAIVALAAATTAGWVAGALAWTLVDATSGTVLGAGSLSVI